MDKEKRWLSLSLKEAEECFWSILNSKLEEIAHFKMPKNSAQSSKWAMRNLPDWVEDHNRRNSVEILLSSCSKEFA